MAQTINKIDYAGVEYEFVDTAARDKISIVSRQIEGYDSKVSAETNRAIQAETLLGTRIDDISDIVDVEKLSKQLAAIEERIDNPLVMTGATSDQDGAEGVVPAPEIANKDMYLKGDGTWDNPPGRTILPATRTEDGLMSRADKIKLDGMIGVDEDLQTYNVEMNGNVIRQTFKVGNTTSKEVVTTFNDDGTISQSINGSRFRIRFTNSGIVKEVDA